MSESFSVQGQSSVQRYLRGIEAREELVAPLKWTKDVPKVPGWYWRRHPPDGSQTWDPVTARPVPTPPYVECVRVYAGWRGEMTLGEVAVDRMTTYEWAGPIPEPS